MRSITWQVLGGVCQPLLMYEIHSAGLGDSRCQLYMVTWQPTKRVCDVMQPVSNLRQQFGSMWRCLKIVAHMWCSNEVFIDIYVYSIYLKMIDGLRTILHHLAPFAAVPLLSRCLTIWACLAQGSSTFVESPAKLPPGLPWCPARWWPSGASRRKV